MASMGCKDCHRNEQQREPVTDCAQCHRKTAGLHRAEAHAGAGCAACHAPHAWSPEPRKTCLTCHTDKEQHNPGAACAQCHEFRSAAAAKAEAKAGPPPIRIPTASDSPGPVTFAHATHLAKGATCADCHPKLFKMQKGGATLSMDGMGEGKTCGACHNGQKAFGVMDGDRCTSCHKSV
jgi:c(7)-type cytochrome triheme protein